MKLRRPEGRWWAAAEWVIWVLVGSAVTLWIVSDAEQVIPRWRVAAAMVLTGVIGALDVGTRPMLARLAVRHPWSAALATGVVGVGGVAAWAATLGVLHQFGPVLLGVALGSLLGARTRGREGRRADGPLWSRNAPVEPRDDGRRWRTGAP